MMKISKSVIPLEEKHSYSFEKNGFSSSFKSAGYRLEWKYKMGEHGQEKGYIRAKHESTVLMASLHVSW